MSDGENKIVMLNAVDHRSHENRRWLPKEMFEIQWGYYSILSYANCSSKCIIIDLLLPIFDFLFKQIWETVPTTINRVRVNCVVMSNEYMVYWCMVQGSWPICWASFIWILIVVVLLDSYMECEYVCIVRYHA